MAKLKQKEWMTITEAAQYLSGISENGPIEATDILQFAMDGEITLSIRTTRESAEPIWTSGVVPYSEASKEELNALEAVSGSLDIPFAIRNTRINGVYYVGTDFEQEHLPPFIWDVNEFLTVDNYFMRLWNMFRKTLPEDPDLLFPEAPRFMPPDEYGVSIPYEDRILLTNMASEIVYCLPTRLIPEDSYLVIRKEEMQKLFENTEDGKPDQPLSTREKKTYLKVIRALCEEHKDIDLGSHSTAANQLMAIAETRGLAIPSKRTLENLLRETRNLDD